MNIRLMQKKEIMSLLTGGMLLFAGCSFNRSSNGVPASFNLTESLKQTNKRSLEELDYNDLTYKQAIKYVKTPKQAQDYAEQHIIPNKQKLTSTKSFKEIHSKREVYCVGYSLACAALLSDNGYPSLLLYMFQGNNENAHAVFLYKTKKGYNALGNTPRMNDYASINDLVKSFTDNFGNPIYKYFKVENLDKNYPDNSWIDGNVEIQKQVTYFMDDLIKVK
jgi:hypothetical protein